MRLSILFPTALLLFLFSSCAKTNGKPGSGTDSTGRLTKPSDYVVSTYAGKGVTGPVNRPSWLCVDEDGNLYVSRTNEDFVMKIDPLVQSFATFSGDPGNYGCADDVFGSGSPSLTFPENLWYHEKQIFIGDYGCGKLKVASLTGQNSAVQYNNPYNLNPIPSGGCIDVAGNIYMYSTHDGMYEVRAADQVLIPFANTTDLGIISSLTMDPDNTHIYISSGHNIKKISVPGGDVSVVAGTDSLGFQDGSGSEARFGGTMAICVDPSGNIYVADTNNNAVRKISGGTVTTIAGGTQGDADGTGDKAQFHNPTGIAYTTSGENQVLYVSDYYNNTIRRITFPK